MRPRQSGWRRGSRQQLRNKCAHVMCTRASTPADWQTWLEGVPVAHRFVGRAGEAHRVFVFSADTFGREGDEPWWHLTDLTEAQLTPVITFLTQQTGPYDILLFFGGRNAATREVISKLVKGTRHLCDVWIVYALSHRAQGGECRSDRRRGRRGGSVSPSHGRISLSRAGTTRARRRGGRQARMQALGSVCPRCAGATCPRSAWQTIPMSCR